MAEADLLSLTARMVAAYVGNNPLAQAELPTLIAAIYRALTDLGRPPKEPGVPSLSPAEIRRSVKNDTISCFECGRKLTSLKRHLHVAHDTTPEAYRDKWSLAASYPMVAPAYAAVRADMAKKIGLGRKTGSAFAQPDIEVAPDETSQPRHQYPASRWSKPAS